MSTDRLRAYARHLVATWPPLTTDQAAAIRGAAAEVNELRDQQSKQNNPVGRAA